MRRYRTKIKICGLTGIVDASAAAQLGADFLGFVFAPSRRRLDVDRGRSFWEELPGGIPRVGVFRDQGAGEVESVLNSLTLDYLQFHGQESPAFCRSFGLPVIRACSARDVDDLLSLEGYADCAEIFLVDLPKEERGARTLSLEVAQAAADLDRPALIAGGLDPATVGEFIQKVRPYGVDVARGVEASPGTKDPEKLRGFFERVRRASGTIGLEERT